MKNKKIWITIISICFILCFAVIYNLKVHTIATQNSQNKPLTKKEKIEDFNYLYTTLEQNFPYFEIEKKKTGFNWLEHKNEFKKEIKKTEDDLQFIRKLEEILFYVQNGHTNLIPSQYINGYIEAYCGHEAWNKVLKSDTIKNKLYYWMEVESNNTKNYTNSIPVKFEYIEGKYLSSNLKNTMFNGIEDGNELIEVNGSPVHDYVKSLINKTYLQYDYKRNKLKKNTLILETEKSESIRLKLKNFNGNIIEKNISTESMLSSDFYNRVYSNKNIILENLKDGKIAYMKIMSMDNKSINNDMKELDIFLERVSNYPYFIIDIRGNGGGSDNYWNNVVSKLDTKDLTYKSGVAFKSGEYIKPFIKTKMEMCNFQEKPINEFNISPIYNERTFKFLTENSFGSFSNGISNTIQNQNGKFKGKIFLLVDDYVFSSSESFAAFCKGTGFATLIGTNTGGDGIGFDPAVMVLPNSGIVIRFPFDMGLNPDGTINEEVHTSPNIYAEQTATDFIKDIMYRRDNPEKNISPYDTVLNLAVNECK